LTYQKEMARPRLAATAVVKNFEIFLPLADLIDVHVERQRLQKEQARLERLLEGLNERLYSHDFIAKAPPEVVERERQKKTELEGSLQRIVNSLRHLSD